MTDTNPLTHLGYRIPFHQITAAHVPGAIDALLVVAQQALAAIKDHEGPHTWASSLGALDRATEPLDRAWGIVEHLRSVNHSDALTEAHAAALPKVTRFYAGISLDPGLYAAVKAFAATPEAAALTGPRKRYLDKTIDDFRRNGADLDAEAKQRFEQISTEMAEIGSTFGTHVVKETATWDLVITDEGRLAGLPPSAMAMARALAEEAGVEGWRFTLQFPSTSAVLTHLDDRAIREQVWRAYNHRCTEGEHANGPLITRLIALRHEQAQMLGYADFSDYILANRMAKSGAKATAFLADIEAKCRAPFEAETADLAAFAATHLGIDTLQPWDVAYAAEKQRKARYDLDAEDLRPYFSFAKVLRGVFDLCQRLYGIDIRPADLPVWHPSVETYEVFDGDTLLGGFYVDFAPRPTKRQGAWMNALITGGPRPDGSFAPHLGLICGNATPPTAGRPALLTHREVETVFHEFGHLLHHLLTTSTIRGQAGTNVAWDFVELPSQIMENWTWSREALDLFAVHFETGDTIPDELFERMIAARNFRAGSGMMRQLGFGLTDLALHRTFDPATDGDVLAFGEATLAAYSPTPSPAGHSLLPTFLHLFSHPVGYAAGYYSYMWASVLDADAFTRFEDQGLFDRATGLAFRNAVLSQGDSADPAELFRRFMGRDPDPLAMLRRQGLAA